MRTLSYPVLILFVFFLADDVAAQTWQYMGGIPDSARYEARAIETKGDTIFVGGSGGARIWRSTDNGETWNTPLQWISESGDIQCFGFHGNDIVFAGGTGEGIGKEFSILRSLDGGSTWHRSDTGIKSDTISRPFADDYVQGRVTSFFSTGQYVLAGTRNGIARSGDNGATWNYVDTVAFDTKSTVSGFCKLGNSIFAAGSKGIWKSDDEGESWTKTSNGIPDNKVIQDIINYKGILVADGYYSEDGGEHWTVMKVTLPNQGGGEIVGDFSGVYDFAAKDNTLFAGAVVRDGGFVLAYTFRSVDSGKTWVRVPEIQGFVTEYTVWQFLGGTFGRDVAANENYVFARSLADGRRIARSPDGVNDWTTPGTFKGNSFLASNNEGVLYSVGSWSGNLEEITVSDQVYKSSDHGATWQPIFRLPKGLIVTRLTSRSIQTTENEIMFVARTAEEQHSIFYSSTSGAEWKQIELPSANGVVEITNGGSSWIARDGEGNYYKTPDQGDSWQQINFGSFSGVTSVLNTDGRLFGIACKNIITSNDGGTTWSLAAEIQQCLDADDKPIVIHGNYIITGGQFGKSYSPDFGAHFYSLGHIQQREYDPNHTALPYYTSAGLDEFRFTAPLFTPQGFISINGLIFLPLSVIDNAMNRNDNNWYDDEWMWRLIGLRGYPGYGADMLYLDDRIFILSDGGVWSQSLEALVASMCVDPSPPTIDVFTTATEIRLLSSVATGNQWYKDGIAIDGATNQLFVVTDPGVYNARVAEGECLSALSEDVAFVTTGLNEIAPEVALYPNPVEDELTILGGSRVTVIRLTDTTGRERNVEFILEGDRHYANVQHLSPGIYMLSLHDGSTRKVFKFLKK